MVKKKARAARKPADSADDEAKEKEIPMTLRLPGSLMERVKRHVARLDRRVPGVTFSRAEAIRSLLTAALDREEAGDGG